MPVGGIPPIRRGGRTAGPVTPVEQPAAEEWWRQQIYRKTLVRFSAAPDRPGRCAVPAGVEGEKNIGANGHDTGWDV